VAGCRGRDVQHPRRLAEAVRALAIEGAPYADTAFAGGDGTLSDAGELTVRLQTLLDADEPGDPTHVQAALVLPAPGVGTHALTDRAAARLHVSFAPFRATAGGAPQIGDRTPAVAREGTATVTTYRAPTTIAYGELVATVRASRDFGSAAPGHAAQLTWTLRVPIRPRGSGAVF
jgi:hypothetical protein